jgi:hypothetical protein
MTNKTLLIIGSLVAASVGGFMYYYVLPEIIIISVDKVKRTVSFSFGGKKYIDYPYAASLVPSIADVRGYSLKISTLQNDDLLFSTSKGGELVSSMTVNRPNVKGPMGQIF